MSFSRRKIPNGLWVAILIAALPFTYAASTQSHPSNDLASGYTIARAIIDGAGGRVAEDLTAQYMYRCQRPLSATHLHQAMETEDAQNAMHWSRQITYEVLGCQEGACKEDAGALLVKYSQSLPTIPCAS